MIPEVQTLSVPTLTLKSLMPRRLLVPLALGRAANAEYNRLFEQIAAAPSPRLAVWCRTVGEDGEVAWQGATMLSGDRLPKGLWQSSVTSWQRVDATESPDKHAQAAKQVLSEDPCRYLDVCFVVTGPDQAALLVTWNPAPVPESRARYLYISDSAGGNIVPDGADEIAVHFQVPEFAVAPGSDAQGRPITELSQQPPGESLWDRIRNVKAWRFQLRDAFVVENEVARPSEARKDTGALAIDFGTSASTVAYLHSSDPPDRPTNFLSGLLPWAHCTGAPRLHPNSNELSKTGDLDVHDWGGGRERIAPGYPIVPDYIKLHRLPHQMRDTPIIPSLLYELPKEADEETTVVKERAIGQEAQRLMEEGANGRARVTWENFKYSPRNRVGRVAANKNVRQEENADVASDPVEAYLVEFLDQALNKMLIRQMKIAPALSRVCYSYPVAWTKSQRQQFKQHLAAALHKSRWWEFVAPESEIGLLDDAFTMDETSAAFLGFIQERFRGLEGEDLVQAFQPFDPAPRSSDAPPTKIHVLVFDCGAGTTDMVLLEMSDPRQRNRSVESRVLRHFSIERAGLEVTRRIAEILKELFHQANAEDQCKNWLCTNLRDSEGHANHHPSSGKDRHVTVGDYRRQTIAELFIAAESLKMQLATGQPIPAQWASKIFKPGLKPPVGALPLDEDRLRRIVEEVLKPAFHQIDLWLKDGPRIDLLLISGRSSRLPGLQDRILRSIPAEKRPYLIDVVRCDTPRLDGGDDGSSAHSELSKTVVCSGLDLNYRNKTMVLGKGMLCHPIDEQRRTRAFGVLQMDLRGHWMPVFHPDVPLLAEADNEPIVAQNELVFEECNPLTQGFSVGINFSGRTDAYRSDNVDPPQHYLRVAIDGGTVDAFKSLRFVFNQTAATEIRLRRIDLLRDGHAVAVTKQINGQDLEQGIVIGPLRIHGEYGHDSEDFRETGRIHTPPVNPID